MSLTITRTRMHPITIIFGTLITQSIRDSI